MASMEFCQFQQHCNKYVARTMRCLPDRFIELCHRHLAVLLDLSGDKLELLLSGHEEHKKKKLGLFSVGMFRRKDTSQGSFGLPLTHEGVCLMMPLIKFLTMDKNVKSEGLFRKTGNKNRMTRLRELLISDGPAVRIDPGIFSAHDVACVLKEFIRELPEPLLTERHLEAHLEILALGQHAETPEEIATFSSKKLSAVQLLMLLLPSPAQILTLHLVKLLKRTADSPGSKMTPATLGTIFAPIFFINKKVQVTDLLSQISRTAPVASFIIDRAHELFQPPKELVMDLTNFWKSMKGAFLHTENREPSQLLRSLSGQTLHADENNDEGNLSRCEDDDDEDVSNISAELTNMLVRMQIHNDVAKRSFDAPKIYAGLRRRSKSIGSSIRKRLASLKLIRNRQRDVLGSIASSTSGYDSKTTTSAQTRLFECSSDAPEVRSSLQLLKPGQKRRYTTENCSTAASSCSSNPPAKQMCQETETCKTTQIATVNRKRSIKTGWEALFGCSTDSSEAKRSLQLPKPGHKRPLTSENCSTAASSNNPPIKQRRQEAETSKTTRIIAVNGKIPNKAGFKPLFECSADNLKARSFVQLQKPGQKRCYPSEKCAAAASSGTYSPLAKQKCQETGTFNTTSAVSVDHKHSNNASSEALFTSNRHFSDVFSDVVEKRNPRGLILIPEDSITCDVENKENKENLAICDIKNEQQPTFHFSHFNGKSYPVNSHKLQKKIDQVHTDSSDSLLKPAASDVRLDKPVCFHLGRSNSDLSIAAKRKMIKSMNASRKSKSVTNTSQRASRKPRTTATTRGTIRLNKDDILETSI